MRTPTLLICALLPLLLQQPATAQQDKTTAFIKQHDKNKDGKLSKEETPDRFKNFFNRIDTNKDGYVTVKEDQEFRKKRQAQQNRSRLPQPDFSNVKYGPDQRNIFDLWQAKGEGPKPLVIYYHGGGFRSGDKRTLNKRLFDQLLAKGITVAAANYRLSGTAPFPAQMHDSARCLQYIRLHAKEYNIDPKRIGATGGSAGAGISQWLAFHDDLAKPKSKDPIEQQSTRLTCAVVYAAQTTYDPREHKKMFNTDKVDSAIIPFFGMSSAEDVDNPKFHPLFEESSPINHATADDPPVLIYYPQQNKPVPPNAPGSIYIHHPKFGKILKEKLDKLGVECIIKHREDYKGQNGPVPNYVQFFIEKLKPKK